MEKVIDAPMLHFPREMIEVNSIGAKRAEFGTRRYRDQRRHCVIFDERNGCVSQSLLEGRDEVQHEELKLVFHAESCVTRATQRGRPPHDEGMEPVVHHAISTAETSRNVIHSVRKLTCGTSPMHTQERRPIGQLTCGTTLHTYARNVVQSVKELNLWYFRQKYGIDVRDEAAKWSYISSIAAIISRHCSTLFSVKSRQKFLWRMTSHHTRISYCNEMKNESKCFHKKTK